MNQWQSDLFAILINRERYFSQPSFGRFGVVEEGSSHHFLHKNRGSHRYIYFCVVARTVVHKIKKEKDQHYFCWLLKLPKK